MKFVFPLEKLKQNRKRIENLARKDFLDADNDLREQNQILKDMMEEITRARDRAFALQMEGGSAHLENATIDEFIKGQDLRIKIQQAKVREVEKLVELKREILREKSVDYKITEKLRERKKAEFDAEIAKREQKELDEQGSRNFYIRK